MVALAWLLALGDTYFLIPCRHIFCWTFFFLEKHTQQRCLYLRVTMPYFKCGSRVVDMDALVLRVLIEDGALSHEIDVMKHFVDIV